MAHTTLEEKANMTPENRQVTWANEKAEELAKTGTVPDTAEAAERRSTGYTKKMSVSGSRKRRRATIGRSERLKVRRFSIAQRCDMRSVYDGVSGVCGGSKWVKDNQERVKNTWPGWKDKFTGGITCSVWSMWRGCEP